MHSVNQQQQQRRGNSTRMPLMYSNSLPPVSLLQVPSSTLRYGSINMKHHQRANGNRGSRGLSIAHRQQQQRIIPSSRHHPYQFRQPLLPQRPYRPAQLFPRTPAALMGTPPGMSQTEYERIHSAQVRRDKEKLVRHGQVLAPSNTTQFLIHDHNRQTTPSSITTSTQQTNNSSPSNTEHQPSLTYDQMFEMGDVDAQSDDTGSIQDINADPSFDDDFNDIYYQCRYERYAAFNRTALLNEVLSLCTNIDRLQHEKSEVEKRLQDVQKHIYAVTRQSNNNQEQSKKEDEVNPIQDELQLQQETNETIIESNSSGNE